jgi:hypothetical protein
VARADARGDPAGEEVSPYSPEDRLAVSSAPSIRPLSSRQGDLEGRDGGALSDEQVVMQQVDDARGESDVAASGVDFNQ